MITPLYHLLSFALPASTCAFLASAPHSSAAALAWTVPFWLVLLLDWQGPKAKLQPANTAPKFYYEAMLLALTILQCVNIELMLNFVSNLSWLTTNDWLTNLVNLTVVRFVVGTSSGTSAIVVAHELIHRPQKFWQYCANLLLLSVCYQHFHITHKQGHHLDVGMTQDIATARFGESFKDYWRRVYIGHLRYAWHLEQQRLGFSDCQVSGLKIFKNQVFQWLLLEFILLLFITYYFGWLATVLFVYQAVAAVRILEAVNYFQHWGLADGRFGKSFGWVNSSWLTGFLFLGLANHIGHHTDEHAAFYKIPYSEQGPKLPYGYFVMNLWVKLANKSYQKMARKELKRFQDFS